MNNKASNRMPLFTGIALIAIGLLINKPLVEAIFASDQQIEHPLYVTSIYIFQLLAIGAGIWILIKKPSIRLPKRTELFLFSSSILLTFFLLEGGARLWLNFLATPELYDRFVFFHHIQPYGVT